MALQLKAKPSLRIKIVVSALVVLGVAAPLSLNFYRPVLAQGSGSVVINEFSSFDSTDWVELYNPTSRQVTMVNWTLRDSSATQLEVINGTLSPQGFLFVNFSDYLNKTGDTIKLYDTLGLLVNEVVYVENGAVPTPGSMQSASRIPDGGASWALGETTKGATNTPDRQAPDAVLVQPGPGEFFGGGDRTEILMRASLSDNKSLKSFHMSVDGAETASPIADGEPSSTPEGVAVVASATVNTAGLSEGSHVIAMWAIDDAGNVSNKAEVSITVDKTSPLVAVSVPVSGQTVGGEALTLTGSVTDLSSSVRVYYYYLLDKDKDALEGRSGQGSQAVENGQLGTLSIDRLESGDYYVRVWATDNASNTSLAVDVPIVIDHTPPRVTVNSVSSPNPTASTPVQLQGEAGSETITSLMLYIEDTQGNRVMTRDITKQLVDGKWQYTISEGLSQGLYKVSVIATDQHGNASTVASSPLSVMSLSVGPYVPPVNSAISGGLTANLSNPFFVPQEVKPVEVPVARSEERGDILGSRDEQPANNSSDKVAVAATESGWRFFGILWYWWVLGAGVAGGLWWTMALAKRHVAEDAL